MFKYKNLLSAPFELLTLFGKKAKIILYNAALNLSMIKERKKYVKQQRVFIFK